MPAMFAMAVSITKSRMMPRSYPLDLTHGAYLLVKALTLLSDWAGSHMGIMTATFGANVTTTGGFDA
jgi:hypothetical protein